MIDRLRVCATRAALGLLLLACTGAYAAGEVSSAPRGGLDAVRSWLEPSAAQSELLPPDEAYRLNVRVQDARTLVATLTPAKDYYLYRERISFKVEDPPGVAIESVQLPVGEPKQDPVFGKTEVYHRAVEAVIRLAGAHAGPLRLHASYQGCNEPRGVCYPPIEKTIMVAMDGGGAVADRRAAPVDDGSETGRIHRLFTGGSWALAIAFFGFGTLLAFTPCMLPMIPILSGIIVGRGMQTTKRHALGLSAAYVLGMAITYAAAGVAAGLAGSLLSAYLQGPWALGAFAAIFVLLALSMFGLYQLQLPSSLQGALARAGTRIPGGRAAGAFVMGALSALIIGPCVAAPLAGALLYISQTRDAWLGGTALFSMAVGMGVPLLVVGATAGPLLRRAGAWTESVKRLVGVMMLAVAIYVVSPVTPLIAQQLMWSALLIGSAIFMHAIDPLPPDAPGHRRLLKGLGVIGLVAGIALLVGALSGSRDLLQPLAGLRGSATQSADELPFQPVKSVAELDARLQAARGRYVMLDFWAEWCVSCKEMDRYTFGDAQVQARLKDMLLLRADVSANNADDRALLRRFGLFGPPGIVFFDAQGRELPHRVIGFEPPQRFLASVDRALGPALTPVVSSTQERSLR